MKKLPIMDRARLAARFYLLSLAIGLTRLFRQLPVPDFNRQYDESML